MSRANAPLPPGVWYEAARSRYRVRLYAHDTCIWLSYHGTADEAITAWRSAKAVQEEALANPPAGPGEAPASLAKLLDVG
jgi:hypothetical protein